MRNLFPVILLLLTAFSCNKSENEVEADNTTVTTGTASSITMTSAIVSASIQTSGNVTPVEYGIVWSTTPAPTTSNAKVVGGNSSASTNYQVTITGLSRNQTYYVRAYAKNSSGTKYGQEISFKTLTRSTCSLATLEGGLGNNVVLYLPFCGNANDQSASANHGIVSGAQLTTDRFGNPNSAYLFNGTSSKITVPDHPLLNSSSLSVSVWYKTSNFSNRQWLLQKSDWATGNNEVYTIATRLPSQGHVIARYKTSSGCQRGAGWMDILHTSQNPEWHHIVLTNDGNAGKLYFDGTLIASSQYPGAVDICPGGALTIGAGWANDPAWWDGLIDDVIIYNRALTAAEVAALSNDR